jgi:Family of unknown function (DUF5338)
MTGDPNRDVRAFVDRMAKRLKDNPKAPLRGRHRAAFIAVRPLVEGGLTCGYTMKATWEALREEGKLSMTYETFRAHCRQVGLGRLTTTPPSVGPGTGVDAPLPRQAREREPARSAATSSAPPATQSRDQPRGFRHERVPQKKEIYG